MKNMDALLDDPLEEDVAEDNPVIAAEVESEEENQSPPAKPSASAFSPRLYTASNGDLHVYAWCPRRTIEVEVGEQIFTASTQIPVELTESHLCYFPFTLTLEYKWLAPTPEQVPPSMAEIYSAIDSEAHDFFSLPNPEVHKIDAPPGAIEVIELDDVEYDWARHFVFKRCPINQSRENPEVTSFNFTR